ncbi:acyl carrier protein [Chromobacterium haemolyticum]|uniref:acyl carrier protein n=1 Tax=Chromobacterium haemolyticum TaxID=394935 RepID=UPI0040573112
MKLREKVAAILAEAADLPVEAILEAADVETLGLDSLSLSDVLFELEKAFQVEISDEEAGQLHTLLDFEALLQRKLAESATAG